MLSPFLQAFLLAFTKKLFYLCTKNQKNVDIYVIMNVKTMSSYTFESISKLVVFLVNDLVNLDISICVFLL